MFILSDIVRSAKEEIARHKHNLHVIRRNMSKNRMKKIACNNAPIKAKELIDFLIHNGLIDVRRNASVVIKVTIYFEEKYSFKNWIIISQTSICLESNNPILKLTYLSTLCIVLGICIWFSESFPAQE